MHYICLIYETEALYATRTEAENNEIFAEYMAFTQKVKEDGVFIAGEPLLPTETAVTVRKRNDQTVSTDGPFAETKEQLGGFYILDCPDIELAKEYASQIPSAKFGSIEVRPIMELPDDMRG